MHRRTFCKIAITTMLLPTVASEGFTKSSLLNSSPSGKKQRIAKLTSKVAIIYYSLDGNTKIMADEIAKKFRVSQHRFSAKKYEEGLFSGTLASKDAWNEVRMTEIDPEKVDLSPYDFIFLGSPIWWYRPAVPMWSFVEKNRFQGQNVVLFNTFNSRFKDKHIQVFSDLLGEKGGKLIDHIYVRRGRIYNQIDTAELIDEVQTVLRGKESKWGKHLEIS